VKHLLLGTIWMLLAMIPLAWCAPNERVERNQPVVNLRDSVEVRRSRVWLSDLLPTDAPLAIRKATAAIELGQAPQPGSARVFEAEQIASKLVGQPEMLRQLAIPPRIRVRYLGWPIAEAAVRTAISKFLREQLPLGPKQRRDLPDEAWIEWPRPLAAAEESPTLQAIGMEWDNRQQSMQVRLRCSTRASCGSFLVHVVLPAPYQQEWRSQLGAGLIARQGEQTAATAASSVMLAQRGKAATLVLDDGNMRISVQVICLQAGVLDQQIRVFDAKSRHVFHGEVVGASLLHATL
jgi:hypothetical protein